MAQGPCTDSDSQHAEMSGIPPNYDSDACAPPYASPTGTAAVRMLSLSHGDPNEVVSVPMIHSTEVISFKKLFSSKRRTIVRSVSVRKMPRFHYLKHYAKDTEGNYVGTEKRAPDAGLVFVPSKANPEDILKQVEEVAFGKMHYTADCDSWNRVGASTGAV